MNFFEQQEKTKQKTALLVLLYVMAVVSIIGTLLALWFRLKVAPFTTFGAFWTWVYEDEIAHWIIGGVLSVIFAGGVWGALKLRGGGKVVAEMVGAEPLSLNTEDPKERQFINIVQEMAIASGMPCPLLYIMREEPGINAFVAGYSPMKSVLVVTDGTLLALTRDELQGVVAHEFSHIFNGDMRLNLRLMAVLAGIVTLGALGQKLFFNSWRFSRGSKKDQSGLYIMLAGLAIWIVGSIGIFFAQLIKAAISRQREALADASAVQFTRNPRGIGGALCRIKENTSGSNIKSPGMQAVSHMCFGSPHGNSLAGLLATHPPIEERIRALGVTPEEELRYKRETRSKIDSPPKIQSPPAFQAMEWLAGIGQITVTAVAAAETFRSQLPDALSTVSSNSALAKTAILALLGVQNDLTAAVSMLPKNGRYSFFLMALSPMINLPDSEKAAFFTEVEKWALADNRVTPFEKVILCALDHVCFPPKGVGKLKEFAKLQDPIEKVLSWAIGASAPEKDIAIKLFSEATDWFGFSNSQFRKEEELTYIVLRDALRSLNRLTFPAKRKVLEVVINIIQADGQVMPAESDLIRAIGASLGIPMSAADEI